MTNADRIGIEVERDAALAEVARLRTVIQDAVAYLAFERWDSPDFDPIAMLARVVRE